MAIEIDYSASSLHKKLSDDFSQKFGALILMFASTNARTLEYKMKANRPWTDRTNMAKVTLRAVVSQPDKNTIRITLAHGVSYGIWLELANEKNYAIVAPTIKEEGPRVIEDLNGILSQLKL